MEGFIRELRYPDAAWSPRPREPPLTTATLPFKLKMLAKSCNCTSSSAELILPSKDMKINHNVQIRR
jgi:hypothetical protein